MRNGIRERKRRIGGTQRGNEPRSLKRQGLFTSHSPPTTRHYLSTRPAFSPATHSRPSIFSAAYCVRSFEFQSLASAPLIAATDRKQRKGDISNRLKTGGATMPRRSLGEGGSLPTSHESQVTSSRFGPRTGIPASQCPTGTMPGHGSLAYHSPQRER